MTSTSVLRPVRGPGRATGAAVVLSLMVTLLAWLVPGTAQAADGSLTVGSSVSLEAVNYPGRFVLQSGAAGTVDPVGQDSSPADRSSASFVVRAGLAGSGISLESVASPGTYLVSIGGDDAGFDPSDGSATFADGATFRAVAGLAGQGVSLQLWSRPDTYIRHYAFYLYADPRDGSDLTDQDASFLVRSAFTPAAAPPSPSRPPIQPLADCYASNGDGSITVVLGYTNPGDTTVTIPAGPDNTFNPTSYNGSLPTTFSPGTHHGAASVTVAQADLGDQLSWTLEGTRLGTTTAVPQCSGTPLPMIASGGAVVGTFVLAGLVGAVVLRRAGRRGAPGTTAPAAA